MSFLFRRDYLAANVPWIWQSFCTLFLDLSAVKIGSLAVDHDTKQTGLLQYPKILLCHHSDVICTPPCLFWTLASGLLFSRVSWFIFFCSASASHPFWLYSLHIIKILLPLACFSLLILKEKDSLACVGSPNLYQDWLDEHFSNTIVYLSLFAHHWSFQMRFQVTKHKMPIVIYCQWAVYPQNELWKLDITYILKL